MDMIDSPMTNDRLPDPQYDADFYKDVPTKRLIAWFIDVAAIAVITGFLTVFGLFLPLLILPLLFAVVSFVYRWMTLASGSATWGMRLMALEMRRGDGARFDGTTALFHTIGYVVSVVTFPLQLISIGMILMTARHQSLTDVILGTAALNKEAR